MSPFPRPKSPKNSIRTHSSFKKKPLKNYNNNNRDNDDEHLIHDGDDTHETIMVDGGSQSSLGSGIESPSEGKLPHSSIRKSKYRKRRNTLSGRGDGGSVHSGKRQSSSSSSSPNNGGVLGALGDELNGIKTPPSKSKKDIRQQQLKKPQGDQDVWSERTRPQHNRHRHSTTTSSIYDPLSKAQSQQGNSPRIVCGNSYNKKTAIRSPKENLQLNRQQRQQQVAKRTYGKNKSNGAASINNQMSRHGGPNTAGGAGEIGANNGSLGVANNLFTLMGDTTSARSKKRKTAASTRDKFRHSVLEKEHENNNGSRYNRNNHPIEIVDDSDNDANNDTKEITTIATKSQRMEEEKRQHPKKRHTTKDRDDDIVDQPSSFQSGGRDDFVSLTSSPKKSRRELTQTMFKQRQKPPALSPCETESKTPMDGSNNLPIPIGECSSSSLETPHKPSPATVNGESETSHPSYAKPQHASSSISTSDHEIKSSSSRIIEGSLETARDEINVYKNKTQSPPPNFQITKRNIDASTTTKTNFNAPISRKKKKGHAIVPGASFNSTSSNNTTTPKRSKQGLFEDRRLYPEDHVNYDTPKETPPYSSSSEKSLKRNRQSYGMNPSKFHSVGERYTSSHSSNSGHKKHNSDDDEFSLTGRTKSGRRKQQEQQQGGFFKKVRNGVKNLAEYPGSKNRRLSAQRILRSRTKSNPADVICIDDSSEDDEEEEQESDRDEDESEQIEQALRNSLSMSDQPDLPPIKRRKLGSRLHINVLRIAIGKKVFGSGCKLSFQLGTDNPFMLLEFHNMVYTNNILRDGGEKPMETIQIYFKVDCSISEMFYYLNNDNQDSADDKDGTTSDNNELRIPIDNATNDVNLDRTKSRITKSQSHAPLSTTTSSSSTFSTFSPEHQISFLAMRVKPDEKNNLSKYSNSYEQNSDEPDNKNQQTNRRYIVIEMRCNEEFETKLPKLLNSNTYLNTLLGKPTSKLKSVKDTIAYTEALVADAIRDRYRRIASPKTRSEHSKSGEGEDYGDKVLLVYPFQGEEQLIEKAMNGLLELKGDEHASSELDNNAAGGGGNGATAPPQSNKINATTAAELQSTDHQQPRAEGKAGRTHYLTIMGDDEARLNPGEFLNDTLVDFWMRWISRKEDSPTSNFQFFTSHFFTTLRDEGVKAVSSWTQKKNINIFSKNFIFLPINASLHWSLCVICNPGFIKNTVNYPLNSQQATTSDSEDSSISCSNSKELPCILFLDSLKAHQRNRVAKITREWLNFEWMRLKQDASGDIYSNRPFTQHTMEVFDPKIPYQNNSWDCGVFVCRYAYALYQRHHIPITYRDAENRFKQTITAGPEFQFDMADIERIRREMKILVDRLSQIYLAKKEKEDAESKRKKKLARKKKEEKMKKMKNAVDKGG